jgi:hypothetical protein
LLGVVLTVNLKVGGVSEFVFQEPLGFILGVKRVCCTEFGGLLDKFWQDFMLPVHFF